MKNTSTALIRLGVTTSLFFATVSVNAQIAPPPSTTCYPSRLVPSFTAPDNGFNPTAGTAVPLSVKLADDCGNPISNGTVTVSFSNGNADVKLTGGTGGVYTGSWTPSGSTTNFLNATANASAPFKITNPFGTTTITYIGTAVLTGSIGGDASTPLLFTGGTVNAASNDPSGFAAPGAFMSIYGRGLADSTQAADSLPLPTTLAGTSVSLNGQPLPLHFVSATQINVVIPFTTPSYGMQTLTVTRNGKTSNTIPLNMLAADPAVFKAGTSQGVIVNGATNVVADSSNPVKAGDVIVIYANGLGLTSPAVTTGAATPTDQLYPTAARVSVWINNQPAQVFFSGLTPGPFTSLYQINAYVPSGVTPGDNVPVVIGEDVGSIAQRISPPVTISVR